MLEQLLLPHFSKSDVQERIHAYAHPYRELIAYYRCAMMHVETKFNILDEELSLEYDRNPIESIKTRLKSLESIVDKAIRKQVPLTVESIEQNLNDVAGVRVICSHPSDIYTLADAFLKQDDITLIDKKDYPSFSIGASKTRGWTNGTSYTMTTTTNSKELKCVKNTSGTQVHWYYSCGTDMMAGGGNKHPLAPDALTNDVNIKNQVCWSIDNPKGAYTVNAYHVRTTGWLSNRGGGDKIKGTCRADNEEEQTYQFTMLVPNRAKQTWYMDVTFPEIDDPKYAGVKTQLTTALQNQFPDIYQTSIELADLTPESENTIKSIADASRKMLMNPNAMQTLKEYGRTYQLSEYTIKWYNTLVDDNNDPVHGTFVMTVHVK